MLKCKIVFNISTLFVMFSQSLLNIRVYPHILPLNTSETESKKKKKMGETKCLLTKALLMLRLLCCMDMSQTDRLKMPIHAATVRVGMPKLSFYVCTIKTS